MLKINEDKTDRWADRVIYNRTRRSYICRARIVVARQKTNSTILPTNYCTAYTTYCEYSGETSGVVRAPPTENTIDAINKSVSVVCTSPCVCVTQDRDYDGLVETRLYLGVATRSSFRTYTLVAENAISITTKLVQLRRSTCYFAIDDIFSGTRSPLRITDTHRTGTSKQHQRTLTLTNTLTLTVTLTPDTRYEWH